MCCVISCFIKCILGLIATIMLVVGIILTVVGGFLLWGMGTLMKNILPITTQFDNLIKTIGGNGSAENIINVIKENSHTIGSAAFGIGIVLIVLSILIHVSICCCKNKTLFIVLAVILSVLIIGLIVILAIYGSNPNAKILIPLEVYIRKNIVDKYAGFEVTDTESLIVNIVHVTKKCCGIYNYTDFNSINFQKSGIIPNTKYAYEKIKFPLSCCNFDEKFAISNEVLKECVENEVSNSKLNGCWTLMLPEIKKFINYLFMSIGIVIAVLAVMVIALIIMICCNDKIE